MEEIMTATEIKSTASEAGVDICGIAPVYRFSSAPKGFHPNDISGDCRSVLMFAKKLPAGSLFASSCIPYTYINRVITEEVDALTLTLSRRLEALGAKNVPIPSDDPSEYWSLTGLMQEEYYRSGMPATWPDWVCSERTPC
jgi:hypothetical protein